MAFEFAVMSTICALVFFGVFGLFARHSWRDARKTKISVDALVVDHDERFDDDGDRVLAPVYRFLARDGRTMTVTDRYASNFNVPAIGSRITIRYPEGEPELAGRSAKFMTGCLLVGAFAGGLLSAIVAIVSWIVVRS